MSEQDWQADHAKSFAVFLNGDALRDLDEDGRPLRDDSFLLLFNAHHEPIAFRTPPASFGDGWTVSIDTSADPDAPARSITNGDAIDVPARTVIVASRPSGARTKQ
jgi:glycogen operon protein